MQTCPRESTWNRSARRRLGARLAPFLLALTAFASADISALAQDQQPFSPTVDPQYPAGGLARGTLPPGAIQTFRAGPSYFRHVTTSRLFQETASEEFVNLTGAGPDGNAWAPIHRRSAALISIRFAGEARCSEPGSAEPNWCELRVLVNGVEASPASSGDTPDTFAFVSTDFGNNTVASWAAHAMDFHICVKNTGLRTLWVPIQVQWKVNNLGGGTAPEFSLDDWSLTVDAADSRCQTPGTWDEN